MRTVLAPHLLAAVLLAVAVGTPQAQGPGAVAPAAAPVFDPAAVARGRQSFETNCSACHGPDARGGNFGGANLLASPTAMANDGGRALGALLRVGRPDGKMPAFALADDVVGDLSTFLRSLVPPGGAAGAGRGGVVAVVVGDPKAGEVYFNRAGCTGCHSVTGDLKGIGARYDVATIQGRAVMPRGNGGYPRSFLSPPDPREAPRTVTITHPGRQSQSGALVWISDFFVTFVDSTGLRRTVARQGGVPTVVVTDPLAWHIQHLKTLTDKDMHDLTAFLVTLR